MIDIEPRTSISYVGAVLGSTASQLPVFTAQQACRIHNIYLLDNTGVAKNSGNFGTCTIYRKGATGSGTTSVASALTSATAITAFVPWELTLSTVAGVVDLTAGEALTMLWADTIASGGSASNLGGTAVAVVYA